MLETRFPRIRTDGITVDHGTEFTSKAFEEWAYQHGAELDFNHPIHASVKSNGPQKQRTSSADPCGKWLER
jgi:hypothetical protein